MTFPQTLKMQFPTVTFETKCWERDWRHMLTTSYLEDMIALHSHPFAVRALYINNVEDPAEVVRHAEEHVSRGVLTEYHVVQDHAEAALRCFGLTKAELGRGYYYSIAELVAIHLAQTDYVLHLASDVTLPHSAEWIPDALALMVERPEVKVCNLAWTTNEEMIARESLTRIGEVYLGQGFSDQMYLVSARGFRRPIYNESHPASERYPAYGGDLFEKRVDAWMRNHGWLRATMRKLAYSHHGFATVGL